MRRTYSLKKTIIAFCHKKAKLKAGAEGDYRMRGLDGITNSVDMNLSMLWELVMVREASCVQSMGCKELDMTKRLNCLDKNMKNIVSNG